MGLFENDNLDSYVFDITQIPFDTHGEIPLNDVGGPGAASTGLIQLRCFINPYCPFVKSALEQHNLVLNNSTIPFLFEQADSGLEEFIKGTDGVEGIHFFEKYIYRHTYLYNRIPPATVTGVETFEQIENPKFPGVMDTRYIEEQSWDIVRSPFDWKVREIVDSSGLSSTYYDDHCVNIAQWQYGYPPVENNYNEYDKYLDYTFEYFNDNIDDPGINTNNIQMPKQVAATDCTGNGVHWRVRKRTPLYRGEDFFVEFHRHAKATSVNKVDDTIVPFWNETASASRAAIDIYGDTYITEANLNSSAPADESIYAPINAALLGLLKSEDLWSGPGDKSRDRVTYSLYDQAYYIIEMGETKAGAHYYIIICERGEPLFIDINNLDNDNTFQYSHLLSIYKEEAGSTLMNANKLRVTVKNHLGRIVVLFDVDGQQLTPWVVELSETTIVKKIENSQEESTEAKISHPLVVPHARVRLWGGNLLCGFIFGPVQYVLPKFSFVYPQQISLPVDVDRSIKFTMGENYIHDIARYQDETPGESEDEAEIFTQDAHFYKNWGENSDPDTTATTIPDFKAGEFFYRDTPLKETVGIGTGQYNSLIEIKKFGTGTDDDVSHRHKMRMEIKMQCGSHVFEAGESMSFGNNAHAYSPVSTGSDYGAGSWILDSCKTPIITNIRLTSAEREMSRWDDGTTPGNVASAGVPATDRVDYPGYPIAGSPFKDVSHHVMSYTDNWSMSDFYEMQHTGSIQFLLKEIPGSDRNGNSVIWDNSDDIRNLDTKAFYIEIWAGYTPYRSGAKEYTQLGSFFKLFQGICYGGTIDKTYSREVMTCQIKDYTQILKDIKMFNSPFYDGVKDVNAVLEILRMAGFRSKNKFDPAYLLDTYSINEETLKWEDIDGRYMTVLPYALPSSYRRLEQAFFKFDTGTSYYDAIIKIAHASSKLFFFDQFGTAHFENYMDDIANTLSPATGTGVISNPTIYFGFTSNPAENPGQLIYNKLEITQRMEDVHNHIRIVSTTPNQELLIKDNLTWASFEEPDTEGFVGYDKIFFQQEGFFGSEGAVQKIADWYKVMYRPEVLYKFETHGKPIRASDWITVDGYVLRVSKVSHSINPSKNIWWMNVEAERFKPIVAT